MFQFRAKLLLCCVICYCQCLTGNSSPVLVLVANGSDITINFPGENNNNRVFSIVSSSGNNNPTMLDWIGGNGANKAPTITLGKSNAPAMAPGQADDTDDDEDNPTSLSNHNPRWGPQGLNAYDENDGILPLVTTVTPKIPVNVTTSSSGYVETTDKVIAAPV
ncbi:uncharacterized protein LOC125771069 isoform X1 [Anopheles funestus]|uniref:uncharacterized protein LOC125771069 isoform X1 n=1 Tax=Anopheles funestus TaxID=62324 RepID=UPI0020C6F7B4|nr:uncharacterized protein LOC125771069 isoform X1 [Anopheles funestus]